MDDHSCRASSRQFCQRKTSFVAWLSRALRADGPIPSCPSPLPLTSVGAFFDTSAIHRKDEILFAAARTVMLNGIEHFSIVTDQRRVRPASGPVAGAPIGFGLFIFLRFHRRLP